MKLFLITIDNNQNYYDHEDSTKLIVAKDSEEASRRANEWLIDEYGRVGWLGQGAYSFVEMVDKVDDYAIEIVENQSEV